MRLFSTIFLTTGTMIGVGLLALPIMLGLVGFWPGFALTLVAVTAMWLSGYALAERVMDRQEEHGDVATLYAQDLTAHTRWIVLPVYLLVLYGLLVAYFTAGAQILEGLVPVSITIDQWILIVFGVATVFMLFGQDLMMRLNGWIVTTMIVSFIVLLVAGTQSLRAENFTHHDWYLMPFALPVICCAFTYHNIVPFVCKKLKFQRKYVHLSLTSGVLIALMMTLAWFFVVTGSLPAKAGEAGVSLREAYQHGIPATVPLAQLTGSSVVLRVGLIFSLLAVMTSYLAISASLGSFLQDVIPWLRREERRWYLFAAIFAPPLSFALIEPDVFLDMLDIVGGIGAITLFGMLPVAGFIRQRTRPGTRLQLIMVILFSFFASVFLIETGKTLGLLIPPV